METQEDQMMSYLNSLIGKPIDDFDRKKILKGFLLEITRPGDVFTLDFRFDRVSISLDENDVITSVGIG